LNGFANSGQVISQASPYQKWPFTYGFNLILMRANLVNKVATSTSACLLQLGLASESLASTSAINLWFIFIYKPVNQYYPKLSLYVIIIN
jgi:hypothetical protein